MKEVFLSYMGISLAVSVIVAVLLLLSPLLNKKYAAKWKYLIWIFLALCLLIPFSGSAGRQENGMMPYMGTQAKPNEPDADIRPDTAILPGRIIVEIPAQMTMPIVRQSTETISQDSKGITLLDILAFVWLLGGLLFLSAHLISYARFKRQVRKRGRVIEDGDMLRQISERKRELHIRRAIRAIEYSEAGSPMIIGFLKPVLLLPKEQYCEEELFFILKHELVHLKRGDVYIKLLFVTANALHWFNPFIWLLRREAVIDMEMSCDERVIKGEEYAVRKLYTETLLSLLHKQCVRKTVLSTQFYGGKKMIKKRFQNILLKQRKKNGIFILLCAVILTVGFGTAVGCSIEKDGSGNLPAESESRDAKNTPAQPEDQDAGNNPIQSGNEDITVYHTSNAATRTLTVYKEGEAEQKEAALVAGDGFSFYLPIEEEWRQTAPELWTTAINEQVALWVTHFENRAIDDIEDELIAEGYAREEEDSYCMYRWDTALDLIYGVKLRESGNDVWGIFYSYPSEAEDGWGRDLDVIADTFALTTDTVLLNGAASGIPQDGEIYGYILGLEEDFAKIDRQLWVTEGSEDWNPEYNDAAGFEVVDAETVIVYPLHQECTFSVLENHHDPRIELTKEEFESYLSETEYPVLWVIELKDGQIINISEQYVP